MMPANVTLANKCTIRINTKPLYVLVACLRGLAGKAGAARKGLDKLLAEHPDLGVKITDSLPEASCPLPLSHASWFWFD
jgi:hypothetical protein